MDQNDHNEGRKSTVSPRLVARRVLQLGLPLAILALGIFIVDQLRATSPEAPQRQARERVYNASVTIAETSTIQPELKLFGELVATREVELRSLVAGVVEEVNPALQPGGEVRRGDLLMRVSDFNYRGALAEAEANLREARASMSEAEARLNAETEALSRAEEQRDLATRELERAEALFRNNTVAEAAVERARLEVSQRAQSVDQRRNNLAIENARIEALQAGLSRLEWRLEQAERNLQDTQLYAPFDAVIETAPVEIGRNLGANDMVASLYDPSSIEARFTLTDAQYGRLLAGSERLIGRQIRLEWQLGETRFEGMGEIVRLAPRVEAASGGVRVFARVSAEDALTYRPGAFVSIYLPDRRYENVIALPEAALYGGNTVFLVIENRLSPRPVEVAGYRGTDVLLRGDIPDGAFVLSSRISEAGEGLLVNIINADALGIENRRTPLADGEGRRGGGGRGGLAGGFRRQ